MSKKNYLKLDSKQVKKFGLQVLSVSLLSSVFGSQILKPVSVWSDELSATSSINPNLSPNLSRDSFVQNYKQSSISSKSGLKSESKSNNSASANASINNSTSSKKSQLNNDDILKEVFALTEKPRTQENMSEIFNLEKEGQAKLDKRDFLVALTKYQDMYALCKEVKYGDGEGRALERMASIYLSKGEKSRAKSLIENSMELLATSQDKKSLGRTRVTAAQIYLALDNPSWALRQLELAMKDFTTSAVTDSEEAARAMLLAANLAAKLEQPKEALKFYRAAAVHFGQSGDHITEVNLRNAVASLLQELSFFVASKEEAEKAVAVAKNTKDDPLIASALAQLASSQYSLCEFMEARKTLEEVQGLKLDNQPHLALAVISEAYGHSLAATGSLDHARVCLEKTWQVMKDNAPALHKAQVLNALGVLNSIKGNHSIAIEQLRQAADAQSVVGKGRERFALIIAQNLGAALSRAGENRNAKAEYEGILRNMEKMKNPPEQTLAEVYEALAEVCLHLKEIPQADAYVRKSIEVATKISDDATLWRAYTSLAHLQIALQQSADESLKSAASYYRSPQAGVFLTAERNPFPYLREELASDLVSMLLSSNMLEQAFITAEQIKEESFINEWQKNGGQVKASDRELYGDLVRERAHLHAAEISSTPAELQKRWQDWMRRIQMLSNENKELARLISPVPLSLPQLVTRAQEYQATVLNYLLTPKVSFVFVIDKQARLSGLKLNVSKDQLKAQIASFLNLSEKSGQEARLSEKRILQTLYSELLPDQVKKFLPNNPEELVAVVPDSTLFNLPFAALVDTQGRYLVESHTMTTLPAVLSFLDSGVTYGSEQQLVMSASDASVESREGIENNEIASLFQPEQVTKLFGQSTELSSFQEQVKGNSVLHFSAPLLLADNNLLSATLPFVQSNSEKLEAGNKEKPVTTDVLFRMQLPSDLSVWSGTSINSKESLGGGIKIFSRGLAYAGVRNVLLSLWVEQNKERMEELVEFYKGRQQGLNQAQSLRKAQLIALAKDPSPRSWAAFELIGLGK